MFFYVLCRCKAKKWRGIQTRSLVLLILCYKPCECTIRFFFRKTLLPKWLIMMNCKVMYCIYFRLNIKLNKLVSNSDQTCIDICIVFDKYIFKTQRALLPPLPHLANRYCNCFIYLFYLKTSPHNIT